MKIEKETFYKINGKTVGSLKAAKAVEAECVRLYLEDTVFWGLGIPTDVEEQLIDKILRYRTNIVELLSDDHPDED